MACGSSLNGTYADKDKIITLEFKSGGKVIVSSMGAGTELKYSIDGDTLKLGKSESENLILKIQKNGCIKYPMVGDLCKSN